MALNEIAKHFYEKEVDRLLDLEDRNIVKEKFLDMRSQIDDLYLELGDRARRIAELESELAVKEDLLKIKNRLCGEEPLPFTDEQYEEELIEELEERHQQDCITINQLHTTIDTLIDRCAKLREMRGM